MSNTQSKDIEKLLGESILPLMAEMIKAMGEHSYRYEAHIKEIDNKIGGVEQSISKIEQGEKKTTEEIDKLQEKSETQEEVFGILTNVITTFGERLTNLIDTNNRLIRHQQIQMDKMEEINLAFEENTSRLNTLTLAVKELETSTDIEDDQIIGPKEGLNDLATIKSSSGSIYDVLEDNIKKLKNNTEG